MCTGLFAMGDSDFFFLLKESGMHALPTEEYPDKVGVTLKCTRVHEAVSWRDGCFFQKLNLVLVGMLQGSNRKPAVLCQLWNSCEGGSDALDLWRRG